MRSRYGTPAWLNGLLFLGGNGCPVVLVGLDAVPGRKEGDRRVLYAAFTAGIGLWAALLVADELCIAYAVEGLPASVHRPADRRAGAQGDRPARLRGTKRGTKRGTIQGTSRL
jgi:hypothetical protein